MDVILVLINIVVCLYPILIKSPPTTNASISDEVCSVCQLATIRSCYHNTAEYEKQPDPINKYGFFQYGYKKFWLEYDGSVDVGVDISKMVVHEPDLTGKVEIYLPDAEILSFNGDEDTITITAQETGTFTSISSEEKMEAFAKGQEEMRKTAESNNNLYSLAEKRAKILIEQYIKQVGKQMNRNLSVEWIRESDI